MTKSKKKFTKHEKRLEIIFIIVLFELFFHFDPFLNAFQSTLIEANDYFKKLKRKKKLKTR